MSPRKVIGDSVFAIVILAWPVAIYAAWMHSQRVIILVAAGAIVLMLGCAILLKSAAVAGALVAIALYGFWKNVVPVVNLPDLVETEKIVLAPYVRAMLPFLFAAVLGAIGGEIFAAITRVKGDK
jgi:hypothetical protein